MHQAIKGAKVIQSQQMPAFTATQNIIPLSIALHSCAQLRLLEQARAKESLSQAIKRAKVIQFQIKPAFTVKKIFAFVMRASPSWRLLNA